MLDLVRLVGLFAEVGRTTLRVAHDRARHSAVAAMASQSRVSDDVEVVALARRALRVAFDRATGSLVDVGLVSDDVEVVTLAPADRSHRARPARVPFVPPALLPGNMQSAADIADLSTWSLESAPAVPAT